MEKATSALDTDTGYRLNKSPRMRGCTQVIMAHTLSTIRITDFIAAPEQEQAVQQDSHESTPKESDSVDTQLNSKSS